MTERTKLWDSICTTDPQAVKEITGKSYKGHSPKPYWIVRKVTETFGPIGIGWGVTVKSERFERLTETDVVHVAVVSVWYVQDGKRTETFDQMGGTKAVYKTAKGGTVVDEDAGKKSVTDAMVKCLSYIGFAGDIFSGRWDDSAYVKEANEEYREREREAERASAPDVTPERVAVYVNYALRAIADMTERDRLVAWWKDQSFAMGKLGIVAGDETYGVLREAWTKRGKAIAAAATKEAA